MEESPAATRGWAGKPLWTKAASPTTKGSPALEGTLFGREEAVSGDPEPWHDSVEVRRGYSSRGQ